MKKSLYVLVLLLPMTIFAQKDFYKYTVKDIDGNEVSMEQFKGKKIMIVNVASKCGFTGQYENLQKLYEEFKDQNFVIIGFPANNFMNQEPGSNEEIKKFCTSVYSVTFPMMAKISVKGNDQAPIYKWLTTKRLNKTENTKVGWNFQKYLIDEEGNYVKMIPTKTDPYSEEIINWIKGA